MAFKSINPATGEAIATYPAHDAADIDRLLQRAWDTWQSWSQEPAPVRAAFLERLAGLLEERADRYAALITSEMGKLVGEARGEVVKAAGGARHFAAQGQEYLRDEAIPGTPGKVVYQSLGPLFGVMPWNLPFWQVLRFFIPAAMAGNVVLVKHADSVQGSARAIEELVRDAGGPDGLYTNLAIRRDAVAGIIADPRIRAVTVTGSTGAGRAVAEAAGAHGKKAVLELGGSDPFIIFEDADFEKAVKLGIVSRFSNNAQSCIAAKRFIVARPIYDRYVRAYAEAANALPVGDPMSADTRLGPLAKADLIATTRRQIADAQAAGGQVIAGGDKLDRPGNYFAPTVITGLDPNAAIAQEEFFGPVALMFPFDTEDEAVALANATEYGLGGAVWSSDAEKAARVAGRLEAGAVFINDFVRSDARAPFGGVKGSGFGRELGALGARELTNAKLVWTA
ncbi:NAD-dependent succinate-semialdehyde dehydrogenase [Paradevosia shaoguanensis]|uniref:NAD-dependent succinate-semialdehyde dehydrogenase n=1 Tax=Paradevosia shaoguanensis TaxID=1335043 RepID=UPI0019337E1E|nr:NAD-dependent succinate-semialdehyde dehydrogenase [Paradevosia shaoguanensis]